MRARVAAVFGVLVLYVHSLSAAPPAKQDLRVDVGETEVTVAGVTPGGEVVIVGVAITPIRWSSLTRRYDAVVADTDRDGRVTYAAPPRSTAVWVAVDTSSGAVAAGVPAHQTPQPFDFPPNGLRRAADGKVVKLEGSAQTLEILLVRPGAGAWGSSALDGGRSDSDRVNDGTIRMSLGEMKAIAGGAAPEHLRGSDIVVVIDADSLRYAIVQGKE